MTNQKTPGQGGATEEQIDLCELERLSNAATIGPWGIENLGSTDPRDENHPFAVFSESISRNGHCQEVIGYDGMRGGRADAEFIAAARDAIPALIRRVRELELEIAPNAGKPDRIECPDTVEDVQTKEVFNKSEHEIKVNVTLEEGHAGEVNSELKSLIAETSLHTPVALCVCEITSHPDNHLDCGNQEEFCELCDNAWPCLGVRACAALSASASAHPADEHHDAEEREAEGEDHAATVTGDREWEHDTLADGELLARLMDTLAYYHCRSTNPKADHPSMGYHAFSEEQRDWLRGKQREAAEEVLRMWRSHGVGNPSGDREKLIAEARSLENSWPKIDGSFSEIEFIDSYALSELHATAFAAVHCACRLADALAAPVEVDAGNSK